MDTRDIFKDFLKDVRYSARTLARSPGFVAVAVIILALGIGANTTIFTVVHKLFFDPPPQVGEPERLVRADRFDAEVPSTWWSYPDYEFYRDHSRSFAGLAAYEPEERVVVASTGDGNLRAVCWYVSGNYFDVLKVPPAAGRTFLPEEYDHPGEDAVAVISLGLWQRAYGGSEAAIGSTLRLNGYPFTVIGIAPEGFRGASPIEVPPDLWVPIMMQPVLSPRSADFLGRHENQRVHWLQVVGRLADEVSLAAAQADVDSAAAAFDEELPAFAAEGQGVRLLEAFGYEPEARTRLVELARLLLAVVALVLVIAGADLVILLLARGSARRRDLGVRLALGAGRGRIVRQLLLESLLLTLAGGSLGYLLAFWSAKVAAGAMPFRFAVDFAPDLQVLAFTFALAAVTAMIFGLLPALRTSRIDVVGMLKLGDSDHGRSRLRDALVVAQIALSILLVTGAALFIRSLRAAESVDLGFTTENRLLVSLNLQDHGYDREATARFVERAIERVGAVPGVEAATTMTFGPFRGSWRSSFEVPGVEPPPGHEEHHATFNAIGPGYLDVMEIPLLDGRGFVPGDGAEAPQVAIVNEATAAMLWPGESAIGRTLQLNDDQLTTVVGLAKNAKYHELAEEPRPHVYLPTLQAGFSRFIVLAATGPEPMAMARPVEQAIHEIDPAVAILRVRTLEEAIESVFSRYRAGARMVSLFGILALVLASVGLYGVLSYLVVQRTRIIGLQMALGATRERVARSVVGRGLGLAAIGIVLGVAGAWAASRTVESFLYGVEARDPLSFTVVPLVLALVAAVAGLVPAWRASRVDPMAALRDE